MEKKDETPEEKALRIDQAKARLIRALGVGYDADWDDIKSAYGAADSNVLSAISVEDRRILAEMAPDHRIIWDGSKEDPSVCRAHLGRKK
ncbi:hypothetical protein C4568_00720 [Candidatus Parcubacteria bacterium]|nr:MAG: hypothetical protein C4568_00720 [Candidatus Parcubacteria bacterium]